MRTLAVVTLAVAITSPAYGAPTDDIRTHCAEIHRSYQLRVICEREERASKDRLYRSVGLPYGIPRDIWDYCGSIHSSWRIMEVCTNNEIRAKGLLEKR